MVVFLLLLLVGGGVHDTVPHPALQKDGVWSSPLVPVQCVVRNGIRKNQVVELVSVWGNQGFQRRWGVEDGGVGLQNH